MRYISVVQHVFCTRISVNAAPTLSLLLCWLKKGKNSTLCHQHAWHRRSSADGRRFRSGNLRFSSRDRSVDEFDHQHVLLEQGNFLARTDLELFWCEYNCVSVCFCHFAIDCLSLTSTRNFVLNSKLLSRTFYFLNWAWPCASHVGTFIAMDNLTKTFCS